MPNKEQEDGWRSDAPSDHFWVLGPEEPLGWPAGHISPLGLIVPLRGKGMVCRSPRLIWGTVLPRSLGRFLSFGGSSTFWRRCEEPQGSRGHAWNEGAPGHRFQVLRLGSAPALSPTPTSHTELPPGKSSVLQAPPSIPGRSQHREMIIPSFVLDNKPSGAEGRVVLLESYPNHLNQDMNAIARHFHICLMSEVFLRIQLIVQVLQESASSNP